MIGAAANVVIDKSAANSSLAAALYITHYSQFLRGIRSSYVSLFDCVCLGVFHYGSRGIMTTVNRRSTIQA